MPRNDKQKLSRFTDEAMWEAVAQASALREETKADRRRLLKEGEAVIQAEQARRLTEGRKALGIQISREFSTHTLALRESLLRRREEIVAAITDDVREKLAAFAQSRDYLPWLCSLCRTVTEAYPLAFTVYLSERDSAQANVLRSSMPSANINAIIADPAIRLGGVRFYAEENHLLINETLDDSLAHSRDAIIRLLGPVTVETTAGSEEGRAQNV